MSVKCGCKDRKPINSGGWMTCCGHLTPIRATHLVGKIGNEAGALLLSATFYSLCANKSKAVLGSHPTGWDNIMHEMRIVLCSLEWQSVVVVW